METGRREAKRMEERWDAYDRDFRRIEGLTLIRGGKIPEGVYHLVGEVLVPGVLEAGAIEKTDGCAQAAALAERI